MRIETDKIYCGDSLQVPFKTLPSENVNCCVTSPRPTMPYGTTAQTGRSDGKQRRKNMFPAFRKYSMR